jgi:hypothetical protein
MSLNEETTTMLISAANLQAYGDKIAFIWEDMKRVAGSVNDNPAVAGTYRDIAARLLAVPVGANDYEQEGDMATPCNTAFLATGVENLAFGLQQPIAALNSHCQKRGPEVSTAILGLASYLAYLNTVPFTTLMHAGFQDAYGALFNGVILPPASFLSRGISPDLNATNYPNGMGTRAVGGPFVGGAAPDLVHYAPVNPMIVVTTTFVGGTAPPQVVLAGTDSTGALTTTWTLTLDSNNPASAISTTITPAVTLLARQTVTLASVAGIVAGSNLVVNAGLPDQETVIVEAVISSTITAVFKQAHTAGATLTGKRSYAIPPSVSGRRLAALSNITLNITGHSAGAVRIDGMQDRRAV